MTKETSNRPIIKDKHITLAFERIEGELHRRLEEKGKGSWLSSHEMLGIITEEYTELIHAVKSNIRFQLRQELLDLGVAVVFALACMNNDKLDW